MAKIVPMLDFQKIIEVNENFVPTDDELKQYNHWLDTEAKCLYCNRMWKDRPMDSRGHHTDTTWANEIDCGRHSEEEKRNSRLQLHIVINRGRK